MIERALQMDSALACEAAEAAREPRVEPIAPELVHRDEEDQARRTLRRGGEGRREEQKREQQPRHGRGG